MGRTFLTVVAVLLDCSFFSNLYFVCGRDKINELHEWMCQLESEKFDHMERLKRQKYEVRLLECWIFNIFCVEYLWDGFILFKKLASNKHVCGMFSSLYLFNLFN